MNTRRALVVTTINEPSEAMNALAEGASARSMPFVVVGDTKTPEAAYKAYSHFCGIDDQRKRFPRLAQAIPERHYARKNIGYLIGMELGASVMQETDDDNVPLDAFWEVVAPGGSYERWSSDRRWFNVYALFSKGLIWPRGLPLEEIQTESRTASERAVSRALIVQDLADGNPDVDAVYRLTRPLPFMFEAREPIMLAPGTWCPFNSQCTTFQREVFALLYLPSFCSFRMTDIWRSFVAQRCLWEHGEGVIFRGVTVRQDRNAHNLLRDFEAEIPGYLQNERIRVCLEQVRLGGADPTGNLVKCYEALVAAKHLPEAELPVVRAWCDQVDRFVSR